MPADVFRALDDIEYGFMRERVEAEFASTSRPAFHPPSFSPNSPLLRKKKIRDSSQENPSHAEFNETQTTKRSAYRKKVAAAKKKGPNEGGADGSAAEADGDTTMAGADATINSAADSTPGSGQHRAKKARTEGGDSRMDVDDEMDDASDPEDVPDEDEEDEEPQDEDEEEQEQEDEEEQNGGEDELEEREDKPDEDEALDDGNNSD